MSDTKTKWELLEKVKTNIEEGEVEQALASLKQLLKNDNKKRNGTLIVIHQRWHRLKKSKSRGTISHDNYELEYNKIIESLLELFQEIEKEEEKVVKSNSRFFTFLILATLVLLAIFIDRKFFRNPSNKSNTSGLVINRKIVQLDTTFKILVFPLQTSIKLKEEEEPKGIHLRLVSELEKQGFVVEVAENPASRISYKLADSLGAANEVDMVIWGEKAIPPGMEDSVFLSLKYKYINDQQYIQDHLKNMYWGQTDLKPYGYRDLLNEGTLYVPLEDVINWALANKESKNRNWKKAIAHYKDIVESERNRLQPMELISIYQRIGALYSASQEHELRKSYLFKALKVDSNQFRTLNHIGMSYFSLKNTDSALLYLERSISANPKHPLNYGNRSAIYSALGKYDLAMKDLDKQLSLDPDFFIAHSNKAEIFFGKKQYQQALSNFSQAIKYAQKQRGGNNYIASVYHSRIASVYMAMVKEKRFDEKSIEKNPMMEAKHHLDVAMKLNTNATVFSSLAQYHYLQEKWGLAVRDFSYADTILAVKKGNGFNRAKVLNGKGAALMNLNKLKEALAAYNRAIQFNPSDGAIYGNRAACLKKLGLEKESQADYEKMKRLGVRL